MKTNFQIICFDIDNVICKTVDSDYKNSKPDKVAIKIINKLYKKGHYIKIFTARYMGRFKGNENKVKKRTLETKRHLKLWNVKYHELIMCKPTYDLFVDDKSYGFSSNWKNVLSKF